MTIEEAIKHAKEVAEENKINANSIESNMYIPLSVDKDNLVDGCIKCAKEHEQLAEWLEELKFLRTIKEIMDIEIYNQALEDFTRQLSVKLTELPLDDLIVADVLNNVRGIYRQLKK